MDSRRSTWRRLERLHRSRFSGVAIGLVIFTILSIAYSRGWLQPLELGAYDRFVYGRALLMDRRAKERPRIVLVCIREEDIERFKHPIQDGDLARALTAILQQGPRAVGVDLFRTFPVGIGIDALGSLVRSDPRVVFVFQLPSRNAAAIPPPDFAREGNHAAVSDILPDPDGIVRRAIVYRYDEHLRPHSSLAWWLALAYLKGERPPVLPEPATDVEFERRPMKLGRGELWRFLGNDGGYVEANDGDYQVLLDYEHGTAEFPIVSFSDVIDGRVDPTLLRDQVVIVGTTAPSVKDDFYTPIGPPGFGWPVTKGVEIHASAVDQFLRTALAGKRPIRTLSENAKTFWLLVWCLAWGIVGDRVRNVKRLVAAVVVGVALLAASFLVFLTGWWTPVVPPALAWIGAGGLAAGLALIRERNDRNLLDRMLAVHVGPAVRDRLWRERHRFLDEGRLRPQRTCVTVLMTDLEGFTSASERLKDPALVMRWLNEFMDRMVPIVEAHDGLVDGYWGDAIKADFGAPVPRETEGEIDHDAVNAVRCALSMCATMRELLAVWRTRGFPPVRMRIGIFTGPVVVGSEGSLTRQKYTSLGDTVNTAARLESFDKESFAAEPDPDACRILIGESTRIRVGSAFRLEALGPYGIKGKGEKIEIYRVLGVVDTSEARRERG